MKLFVTPADRTRPLGAAHRCLDVTRFPDGERKYVVPGGWVEPGDTVALFAGFGLARQEFDLFLAVSALRSAGAETVTCFIPYLPYARQDKPASGESASLGVLLGGLAAAGADRVITVDPHCHGEAPSQLMLESHSAAHRLVTQVALEHMPRALVTADAGRRATGGELAARLGLEHIALHKLRTESGTVTIEGPTGHTDVPEVVVLYDDLAVGPRTLRAVCTFLARSRPDVEVHVVLTHLLCEPQALLDQLPDGVRSLTYSDTVRPDGVPVVDELAHSLVSGALSHGR